MMGKFIEKFRLIVLDAYKYWTLFQYHAIGTSDLISIEYFA